MYGQNYTQLEREAIARYWIECEGVYWIAWYRRDHRGGMAAMKRTREQLEYELLAKAGLR